MSLCHSSLSSFALLYFNFLLTLRIKGELSWKIRSLFCLVQGKSLMRWDENLWKIFPWWKSKFGADVLNEKWQERERAARRKKVENSSCLMLMRGLADFAEEQLENLERRNHDRNSNFHPTDETQIATGALLAPFFCGVWENLCSVKTSAAWLFFLSLLGGEQGDKNWIKNKVFFWCQVGSEMQSIGFLVKMSQTHRLVHPVLPLIAIDNFTRLLRKNMQPIKQLETTLENLEFFFFPSTWDRNYFILFSIFPVTNWRAGESVLQKWNLCLKCYAICKLLKNFILATKGSLWFACNLTADEFSMNFCTLDSMHKFPSFHSSRKLLAITFQLHRKTFSEFREFSNVSFCWHFSHKVDLCSKYPELFGGTRRGYCVRQVESNFHSTNKSII